LPEGPTRKAAGRACRKALTTNPPKPKEETMTSQTTTEAKAETWDVYAAWFPEQTGDIADPSPYWTENPNEIPDGYAPVLRLSVRRGLPFGRTRDLLRKLMADWEITCGRHAKWVGRAQEAFPPDASRSHDDFDCPF
jgi:hypothetical protein